MAQCRMRRREDPRCREVLDREADRARRTVAAAPSMLGNIRTPGHRSMSCRLGGVFHVQRRAGLAVAQDRDAVGDRQHLVEPVRDIDDRRIRARAASSTIRNSRLDSSPVSAAVGSSMTKMRAGAVRVLEEGGRDLDEHSVAGRQFRYDRLGCECPRRRAWRAPRLRAHGARASRRDRAARIGAPEKDVLGDAEPWARRSVPDG